MNRKNDFTSAPDCFAPVNGFIGGNLLAARRICIVPHNFAEGCQKVVDCLHFLQARVDAHASRESALCVSCGYAADNSVEAVLRIYRTIGKTFRPPE